MVWESNGNGSSSRRAKKRHAHEAEEGDHVGSWDIRREPQQAHVP